MAGFTVLGDTLTSAERFGIQRYAFEILREADPFLEDVDIEIIIPEGATDTFGFKNIPTKRLSGPSNSFLWRQIAFASYLRKTKRVGIDLTLGLIYGAKCITGLYDDTYENHPEFFVNWKARIKRFSYLFRAKRVSKTSPLILTDSKYAKQELVKVYGIPSSKVNVLYAGWQHVQRVEPDFSILTKLNLVERRFYFTLGSSLRHKNLEWVLAAAKSDPDNTYVVTGSNRFGSYSKQLESGIVPNNIIFTGYIRDEEVIALMRTCKAFLFPSLSEGFGIPPLEAIACGADVAISDTSCLPEIYGDFVAYFDPTDYDDIDIGEIINSNVEGKDAQDLLKKYSWKDAAKRFIDLLMSLQVEVS